MAREDAQAVMHLHTPAGQAVSAHEEGLLPLTQTAMLVRSDLAFHDYEGVATDLDERERLVADLGDKPAMVLRHHGLLTVGRTIPEAFSYMYNLEFSCRVQLAVTSAGRPSFPPAAVQKKTAAQWTRENRPLGDREWPALLRLLDKKDPSYRD
jgi:ribulose-5-phosphate 4-epimerase/fuculose-1-phosphate aldolase